MISINVLDYYTIIVLHCNGECQGGHFMSSLERCDILRETS